MKQMFKMVISLFTKGCD